MIPKTEKSKNKFKKSNLKKQKNREIKNISEFFSDRLKKEI